MGGCPSLVFGARLVESGLTDKRRHQPVGIVVQEQPRVAVHGGGKRTLAQTHLAQVEMLVVEFALGIRDRWGGKPAGYCHGGSKNRMFLHHILFS